MRHCIALAGACWRSLAATDSCWWLPQVVMYADLLRKKWVAPKTIGDHPPALLGHTAAQMHESVWLFGGRDTRRAYNTVWRLDTVTHEWEKPVATGTQVTHIAACGL